MMRQVPLPSGIFELSGCQASSMTVTDLFLYGGSILAVQLLIVAQLSLQVT